MLGDRRNVMIKHTLRLRDLLLRSTLSTLFRRLLSGMVVLYDEE